MLLFFRQFLGADVIFLNVCSSTVTYMVEKLSSAPSSFIIDGFFSVGQQDAKTVERLSREVDEIVQRASVFSREVSTVVSK